VYIAFHEPSFCWMRVIVTSPFHAVFSRSISSLLCPFGPLWSSYLSDSFCTLIAAKKIHCTPCLTCAALNYLSVLPLAGKTASQQCPKSPGKNIHQHRPVFPLRCLSILLPLIKSHRFLFIKIMPRKPWILSKVHIQQNAKEEQRHTERMHWKNVQIRLPYLFKRVPNAKAWIGVLNKTHSWLMRSSMSALLCH
jgi:hypothetical protein